MPPIVSASALLPRPGYRDNAHHYAPEFERRWNWFARPAERSWWVDETYVKIRGNWVYLNRAVDREGKTVEFRLSTRRTITLDGYAASYYTAVPVNDGADWMCT